MFFIILYVRKLLFCLILAFLNSNYRLQLALLSLLNVALVVYFIKFKPFKKYIDYEINIITEVLLFGIHLSLLIINFNDN